MRQACWSCIHPALRGLSLTRMPCRRPAAALADSEAAETDPRAVLDFLHIMLEFPLRKALQMVARRPALLHLDVYEDLLPVMAFLEELGLTSQQYAAVVRR